MAGIAIMTLAGGILAGTQTASAAAPVSTDVAIAANGFGSAIPRLIDQRTNPPAPDLAQETPAVLGIDGKPTGSNLPTGTSKASKPGAGTTGAGGANSAASPR